MLRKIFMLLAICASCQMLEIDARKRIKRQFNIMTHDNRIKHDFVMLPAEKQDESAASKENLKTVRSDNSKSLLNDFDKNYTASAPQIEKLRKAGHELIESHKEDVGKVKQLTADLKSKNEKKLLSLSNKRCNIKEFVEQHSKHRKNKYLPHSTGVFEAKFVIPSQHIKPAVARLGSLGSMKLNNMIMYKVGIDPAPSNFVYPKMLLTQDSPDLVEEEPLNEAAFDYFISPFGASRRHNPYRQAFQQPNSPIVDNSWPTHAIFDESPASVREPTQLASLMQNALDTLLANSEAIEDNKSAQQIEFRCPIHQAKASAQIEGDRADVMQVCSCRLIKKAKDDDMKKLK